jgi:hypothetical protein
MLSEARKRIIEDACVTIRKGDDRGRGVLVPGQSVVTAAHCVNFDTVGRIGLGEPSIHEIETRHGTLLRGQVLAVEPVSDSAGLGPPEDDQLFSRDCAAFAAWCEATPPVPLGVEDFPLRTPVNVYVYTHTGLWLQGSAHQDGQDAHMLAIEIAGIEGGTSGSPIVTAEGALIGIVSYFDAADRGLAPRPHLTLPVWFVRKLQS